MLEAAGAFDEALDVLVEAAGLLVVELLTCEALTLIADEVLLEVALEATDDFTDEAELDVLSALADDLADVSVFTDEVVLAEAVLAGAFVDVSTDVSVLAPECPNVTLAALRACSAVRDGCAATVPLPMIPLLAGVAIDALAALPPLLITLAATLVPALLATSLLAEAD